MVPARHMALHDCIGGLAPDMDIISDAVREVSVRRREVRPMERLREAALMASPVDGERARLPLLPLRGDFDVWRVRQPYFIC